MIASGVHLFAVTPGASIPADWYPGTFPKNIDVGVGTLTDSTFCFKSFRSTLEVGFRCGGNVTLWRTSISTEEEAVIEIGSDSYIANASIVAAKRITIGSRVFVAGGVTIVDCDFHPLDPAARLADTIALAPGADRSKRQPLEIRPVTIGDDVWIGYNATVLKGVTIGNGAIVYPGSVVLRDVPDGVTVVGNPAAPGEGP